MDDETSARAETWWVNLTDGDRAELLSLERGGELPGRFVASLTDVFGIGPVGTKWEADPGYTFRVDERVASFLDTKR